MRVFSYVVRVDDGFAPNPFHGTCTLACCKPVIRRLAQVGDLVVGLSARGERVIYAMQVATACTFAEYWLDARHAKKRPDWGSNDPVVQRGDNIYRPVAGGYAAVRSAHHPDAVQDDAMLRRDLSTDRVLIAERFCYFGAKTIPLPTALAFLRVGRGHRSRLTRPQVAATAGWFAELPQGRHGLPSTWSADDVANAADEARSAACSPPSTCDH